MKIIKIFKPQKPHPHPYPSREPANFFSASDDLKHPSPDVVCGLCGSGPRYGLENIGMSRATSEMCWHLDYGERVSREICAGCRRSIKPGQKALDLADGNQVHLADGYECLIRHGERWRRAAREAIARFESGS